MGRSLFFLHRLVVLKLIEIFLLSTGLLCFVLFAQKALCYIELVTEYRLPVLDFLALITFWLPDILVITVPFSFFFSAIVVYKHFRSNQTFTVFSSFGTSTFFFLKPLLWSVTAISSVLLFLTLYLSPLCLKQFRNLEQYLSETLSERYVKEKEFSTFENFVLYTDRKEKSGVLRGIFLSEEKPEGEKIFLTAEVARVVPFQDSLKVTLERGMRESCQKGSCSFMAFDSYDVLIPKKLFALERPLRIYELSSSQLLRKSLKKQSYESALEFYKRISLPFVSFVLALLGGLLALLIPSARHNVFLLIAALLGGSGVYFGTHALLRVFSSLSLVGVTLCFFYISCPLWLLAFFSWRDKRVFKKVRVET